MKNIIITGFMPFGPYQANTTEQFLKEYRVLGGYNVHAIVFSPEIFLTAAAGGKQIVALAEHVRAEAIIQLGMASSVKGLRIESLAVNWSAGKYCVGIEQKQKLDLNQAPWDAREVDLSLWNLDRLFRGLDALHIEHEKEISTDAGTYCCNALMYRTLLALGANYKIPYLSLHVPCTAAAIAGIPDFAADKSLTTMGTLHQIMLVLLTCHLNNEQT